MTPIHCLLFIACFALCCSLVSGAETPQRWSEQKANDWYAKQPWLVGCNYVPAYAINQLEMWQPETFDLAAIDKELALAKGLGFNSVRVFLHDLLWEQDAKGFLSRIDQFLGVADKHGIGVMFVLFDGVWDPDPRLGRQREPKPHTHNSGWVQSPSRDVLKDPSRHETLAAYVKGVIGRFKDDHRVQVWDIYNEPDNTNVRSYGVDSKTKTELPDEQKKAMSLALITKGFGWAREMNPSQPITSGVWAGSWKTLDGMSPMARFCAEQSDVITFHSYNPLNDVKARVDDLRQFNRPLLCTEYMARPVGSTFETILPYFKEQKIGAYNWGFVDGKSQTIYPWDSWTKPYTAEPPVWFHEIFRKDGSAYRPEEVKFIRSLTGVAEHWPPTISVMANMVWLNGAFIDEAEASVSLRDTGLIHAAGVFTTMRANGGRVFRLDAHLQRLRASCEALFIPLLPKDEALVAAVDELLKRNELTDARLRLTVTRGMAEQDPIHGLRLTPTVFLTAAALEPYPAEYYAKGLTVILLDDQKLNPYDVQAGHKTLNYVSRLAALRSANQRGAGEALWFNVHNYLQSGSISNVFMVKDGVLVTPPTNSELRDPAVAELTAYPKSDVLPGVTRAAVMELARDASVGVKLASISVNELLEAEEVFLTNSIMHVMPVCRIERKPIGDDKPGPITRQLMAALEALTQA